MKNILPTGDGFTEGRPYTIGREGQIRIDDSSLSRGHAEIRFVDGRLRLRDLGSTNGTFLVIDDDLIRIKESYVAPCQEIVLGTRKYTVKALLALAGVYVSYSEAFGLVIKPASPDAAMVTVEVDTDELVSRTISRLFEQPPRIAGSAAK
jgi:hypothetical protein